LIKALHKLTALLGFNRSILLASGPKVTSMLMGPIGSIIIIFTLSKGEQAMYYVFMSLAGLRSFFELGATACIGQLTPHHMDDSTGKPADAMISVAMRWMKLVALAFGLVTGIGGGLYLAWCGHQDLWTQAAWLATLIPTAFAGIQEGRFQLIYGAGQVNVVSRLRWLSLFVQYGVQWSLLLCGASLLSFAASASAVLIFQYFMLRGSSSWIQSGSQVARSEASYRQIQKEMVSLVKRSSIVYAAGFFVFQIQQPILYKLQGQDASARFGFTSMILNSLIGISAIWGMTMFPKIARDVATGQPGEGFRKFKTTCMRSATIAFGCFLSGMILIQILHFIPRFSDRLMPVIVAIPLGFAILLQTLGNSISYWPRAFKVEPYAPTAILQMIITPLATWFFLRWLGDSGISWAYLTSWTLGALSMYLITKAFFPNQRRFIELTANKVPAAI
jgi:hypothetical protein